MSDANVIDNEKVKLVDELQRHLPDCKRVSIAVGYFFISGFAEIMNYFEKIENSDDPNHIIRLLVSPVTNTLTAEALLASNESFEYTKKQARTTNTKGLQIASKQVKNTLGYMRQTESDNKAVTKFLELIDKGKLQVKVYTKEQLHAKAYIFELDDKHISRISIVGSSNLSLSGIKEHAELNLRTKQDHDSEKLLEWFERHWEGATEFTGEMTNIMTNSWIKTRKPIDVYQKAILHEYGKFDDIRVGQSSFLKLFDFQKDAVKDALSKINEYGGVIIADVVGTGKSYIGSMILKYLKEKNNSKPLIICPPHLINMWKYYMEEFDVYAEVISRYKIGMDDNILQRYTNCDVILVDESHHFRNKNKAYDALHSFMEQQPDDSCIIMLTATPISNSVNDLKNQLKLFPADRISNIPPLGNQSLDEYFKGTEQDHILTPEGRDKIRELLKHILIRRTRKYIQENFAKKDGDRYYLELESGKKYFPKRNLTNPSEYDIDSVYVDDTFETIQNIVKDLKLARYSPGNYIKEEYKKQTHPKYKKYNELKNTTQSLRGIVKTGLLKRMESSIAAFYSSVDHYAQGTKKFLEYLKDDIVPIGKDFQDRIYDSIMSDNNSSDSEYNIISTYDIEAFDVITWKKDLINDRLLFKSILEYLPSKNKWYDCDDKLKTLFGIIESKKNQKILLFTESKVTAEYLHKYLEKKLSNIKMGQIDSKKSTKEKNELIKRFDPKNNNANIPPNQEIDILVSTDVLSEGVNLQAGKTVINYDFHWNPVKLIQRVGRIDRIDSEHDVVDVVNFLPTTKVESSLHLKERVANKIETIRKIIGHDQKILEVSEDIDENAVIDIYSGKDSVLDGESDGLLDIIQSVAEIDVEKIRGDKQLKENIEKMPLGIRSATGSGETLLVACEAEEHVFYESKIVSEKTFRRYYLVNKNTVTQITASSFLKNVGENSNKDVDEESVNGSYSEMLNNAWKKFDRDMKNGQGKIRFTKIQNYFETKLKKITNEQTLGRRAKILLPKIMVLMVTNRQPYRDLKILRKKINTDDLSEEELLLELESIFENSYEYTRVVHRPRILYSMRVY